MLFQVNASGAQLKWEGAKKTYKKSDKSTKKSFHLNSSQHCTGWGAQLCWTLPATFIFQPFVSSMDANYNEIAAITTQCKVNYDFCSVFIRSIEEKFQNERIIHIFYGFNCFFSNSDTTYFSLVNVHLRANECLKGHLELSRACKHPTGVK